MIGLDQIFARNHLTHVASVRSRDTREENRAYELELYKKSFCILEYFDRDLCFIISDAVALLRASTEQYDRSKLKLLWTENGMIHQPLPSIVGGGEKCRRK